MTRTVLAIGAHIGDMDLTAGPTLAKLVLEGAGATIVALTPGERGHPRLTPTEYKKQKIAEGEAFATAIGADFMVFDHSDGFLPDTDDVAVELATVIREKQPDTIITHWKHSIHSDHEHAARLSERARFLAGLPMDPTDDFAHHHAVRRTWRRSSPPSRATASAASCTPRTGRTWKASTPPTTSPSPTKPSTAGSPPSATRPSPAAKPTASATSTTTQPS